MAALYRIDFAGHVDIGGGVLYLGHGIITGMDNGSVRYDGTYTDEAGEVLIDCQMQVPVGVELVTGQKFDTEKTIPISGRWPADFDNGQIVSVRVGGEPVSVAFSKIRDLP